MERRSDWKALRRLMSIGLFGLLALNITATAFLTYISVQNYPGGEAMALLHSTVKAPQGTSFLLPSSFKLLLLLLG